MNDSIGERLGSVVKSAGDVGAKALEGLVAPYQDQPEILRAIEAGAVLGVGLSMSVAGLDPHKGELMTYGNLALAAGAVLTVKEIGSGILHFPLWYKQAGVQQSPDAANPSKKV